MSASDSRKIKKPLAHEILFGKLTDGGSVKVEDKDKKVRLISITYTSDNKNTPKFEDILGTSVKAEPGADGYDLQTG